MSVAERAARYVSAMPPAISGSGGHAALFAVACALRHGFALGEEDGWLIMLAYSERCDPPWSERELWHKWRCAGTRHSQPCGYLRGGNAPEATKLPIPIASAKLDWRSLAAEATARVAFQKARQRVEPVPDEPAEGFLPIALQVSPGRRILPDDGLDADMRDRLAAIERVLAQRDGKNRVAYTRTEVESCAIGLRRHAGTHPAVDAILERLDTAKKNALTWQVLAARLCA